MVGIIKRSLDASPKALDIAVAAYNYTPNATIGKQSPVEVLFSRRIRTPFDVFRPLERSTELSGYQAQRKEQFDRHNGALSRHFVLGEEVTLELANGFRVSGLIERLTGNAMAEVRCSQGLHTRHLNQLWKRSCSVQDVFDLASEDSVTTPTSTQPAPVASASTDPVLVARQPSAPVPGCPNPATNDLISLSL